VVGLVVVEVGVGVVIWFHQVLAVVELDSLENELLIAAVPVRRRKLPSP